MHLRYPIIGFTGKARAGKDTCADLSVAYLRSQDKHSIKVSCAAPIKEICSDLFGTAFGIDPKHFYGSQDEKEALLDAVPGWTGRRIMQHIGTEGFRHVHPNIWPLLMLGKARSVIQEHGAKAVFVSDVRFLSEAAIIHAAGGLIVRVKNPLADSAVSTHASELELEQIKEDYTIDNQGKELYLLENLVKEFLCQLHF